MTPDRPDPAPPHRVNPAVPRPLSALITALRVKHPARRPASAAAVAAALRGESAPRRPRR